MSETYKGGDDNLFKSKEKEKKKKNDPTWNRTRDLLVRK